MNSDNPSCHTHLHGIWHTKAKSQILCGPNSNPTPKCLVFFRNNCWIMENWTHSTKMGADRTAENSPNASKKFSPKCLPKPKSLRFKKSSVLVSVLIYMKYFTTWIVLFVFWKLGSIEKKRSLAFIFLFTSEKQLFSFYLFRQKCAE